MSRRYPSFYARIWDSSDPAGDANFEILQLDAVRTCVIRRRGRDLPETDDTCRKGSSNKIEHLKKKGQTGTKRVVILVIIVVLLPYHIHRAFFKTSCMKSTAWSTNQWTYPIIHWQRCPVYDLCLFQKGHFSDSSQRFRRCRHIHTCPSDASHLKNEGHAVDGPIAASQPVGEVKHCGSWGAKSRVCPRAGLKLL